MSGTADTEFSIGDKYWCVDPFLSAPLLGTIVALTDSPGKTIGLEFEEEIGGRLSCDGDGAYNRCLWVTVLSIYNESEWESVSQNIKVQIATIAAIRGKRFDKVTLDRDGVVISDESRLGDLSQTQAAAKPMMPAVKE